MTSEICIEGKFYNRSLRKCELCENNYEIKEGYEFSENCGWSDEQQQTKTPYRACRSGTFNDGSLVKCQKCRSCPPPQFTASECKTNSDAICCKQGEQFSDGKCIPQPSQTTRMTVITTAKSTVLITRSVASSSPTPSPQIFPDPSPSPENYIPSTHSLMPNPSPSSTEGSRSHFIGIYACFGIFSSFMLVCLFLFIRRRTKSFNKELKKCCDGTSHESLSKRGITRYEQAISYNIINEGHNEHATGLSHLLAPEVHGAPLKTVLNNLDVLEELVLVLDPDISGAKNTRHLAAQCSFSFAWINYAYSMKDHKSPLVAVLEGVVTKNPDWTVGHLAELLTAIGRNDAVEILAKLPAGV
ncbi:IGF-like family receptor 1 [Carassius gibelio]|uniref:IGF-like family receptor 1 n=1 Tax=Carassius gibelio TaxID=101364 RepID=UPI0022793E21|nr:IGF-like family receptor 1 [Carassius gibelio]